MQNDIPMKVIYVLGNSFSGSTLLGFLLGATKEVEYLGELKTYNRTRPRRNCICSPNLSSCPFWAKYYPSTYEIFDQPNFIEQSKNLFCLLLGKKTLQNTRYQTPDYQFFSAVYDDLKQSNKNIEYLLDTSKSVGRLDYLLQCADIEVKVLYLDRSLYANVASFTKRYKFGFLQGLITCILNNFLIKKYLSINDVSCLKVNYQNLCISPQNSLKIIGNFLDIDSKRLEENMKHHNYHVRGGNTQTRIQLKNGFQGIRKDDEWKSILNKFQIKLLSFFSI